MHSGTTFNPPQHPPAPALAITLDAQPPALVSTRNRPRTAVRRGAAWAVERHQPAAWSLPVVTVTLAVLPTPSRPWLPSRKRRPRRGARRVLAGRPVVVAIEDVRTPSVPFVRYLSASLPVCHGVPGGVDGVRPDTTGQAVSETLSDRGVHGGRQTRPRGHRTGTRLAEVRHRARVHVSRRTGPDAGGGWVAEGSIRIAVLSGQD
jgi:hypothetical protein